MIIDAHVHIHPDSAGFGVKFDASLSKLLTDMDKLPVEKAVVLPIAPGISNVFVHEACSKHPDRLIGFASCDITGKNYNENNLVEEIEMLGLKGLKLHPRMQKFGMGEYDRLLALSRKVANIGLPIIFDSFPYGDTLFHDDSLELIDSIAGELPEAKIILAHAGGIKILDAFLVAKRRPNVYLDISFVLLYFKGSSIIIDMGFLIRNLGSQRIIYGSDFPQMDIGDYYMETERFFESLGLGNQEKEDIFRNNILSLIGT